LLTKELANKCVNKLHEAVVNCSLSQLLILILLAGSRDNDRDTQRERERERQALTGEVGSKPLTKTPARLFS